MAICERCLAFRLTIVFLCVLCLDRHVEADQPLYDLLIKNGKIVDGSGAPWYVADIAISEGTIVRIGKIDAAEASHVIEAKGLVVAPGFVDMMGQSATPMMKDPTSALNLLTQGVTTINAGEGNSAAPLSAKEGEQQGWTTMAEYFALLEMRGLPINVVQTIGHTQVRRLVIGDQDRRPSDEELLQMQGLVEEAMQAGAIGVSTALIYPPAIYAQTEEIAALAKVAGNYGGRYYTHMRNEGDKLLEAIDEAMEIGRRAGTPVHIFHLKAAGQQNWPKMAEAIAKIKQARSKGEQVTADIYPYINNGLGIAALIHPRHFAEGQERFRAKLDDEQTRHEIRVEMETTEGWENWYRHAGRDWNRIIVGRSNDRRYQNMDGNNLDGLSVAEIATAAGEDPWDTFFNLVRSGAFALPETMSEANKVLAIEQEFVSFCTDVGPASGAGLASHPRAFGAFPRLFSRYVRELKAISFERAVAQASAVAANDVMAFDRGRIAIGLAADVIVFDEQQFQDQATFKQPDALAVGMKYVVVNGQIVLEDGKQTDKLPGRVLRGPGFTEATAPAQVSAGTEDLKFEEFDRHLTEFIRQHRIPGMSIAITDKGQLVYCKGYGYADLAKKERVTPESLFRIASISKPVTAVAILKLVEEGKLQLDDCVFDVLDYQQAIEQAGDKFDPRLRQITVKMLLEHRGGWDREKSFDAMFRSVDFAHQLKQEPPATADTVIRAMLTQPLDFVPGDRYAYSNFGYCLLGRVIEQVTALSYEQYVREQILAPMGIQTMRIGATRMDGRAKNEVRYYHPEAGTSVFAKDLGEPIASPYGAWYLEAMDAHGGWIASASDLAKFALALENSNPSPLLSKASLQLMHGRPPGLAGFDELGKPKDVYYSLGWLNRVVEENQQRVNHWHTGSLPGTATILIRRHDGKNMVALLNTRVSPTSKHLGVAVDQVLHEAVSKIKSIAER